MYETIVEPHLLTPEEFRAEMAELFPDYRDEERSDVEADKVIVALLKALGYTEGAVIFENAEKWYA